MRDWEIKQNTNGWYVVNNDGDVVGHDLDEARAKELAAIKQANEPDAEWEALQQ